MPAKSVTDWDVFVSYSTRDSSRVLPVVEALKRCGLRAWLDRDIIEAGRSIFDEINSGLARSQTFLLFLSEPYLAGEWTKAEMRAVLNRVITSTERQMHIVLLDPVEVPDLLRDRRRLTLAAPDAMAEELARAIGVSSAGAAVALPAGEVPVTVDELDEGVLDVLFQHVLENQNMLMSGKGPTTVTKVDLGPGERYRIAVKTGMLRNPLVIMKLRQITPAIENLTFLIGRLTLELLKGGLSIFTPRYELEVRDKRRELDGTRKDQREQFSAVVQQITLGK